LEEKVGAAPFGTRAISEAAAALSDSQSLEESQEALTELLEAVDACDPIAELDATGPVAAFLPGGQGGGHDQQLGDQATELGAAGALAAFHPTTPTARDQHDQQSAGSPTAAELPPILDPGPDQILAAARAWAGDPGLQATDLTGEDREAMVTLLKAPDRYVGLCRLQGIEPDDPAPGPREGPGRWEFAGEQYRQAGAARDAAAAQTSEPTTIPTIPDAATDVVAEIAAGAAVQPLVDDGAWLYQGFHGALATRRLRVWRTGPGQVTAVVTEAPTDEGTSITNAIESVIAQLQVEYPDDDVEVIEHYLPRTPDRQDSDYQRWTLTATPVDPQDWQTPTGGPVDGQQIEFPPAAEHIPQGSLDRVTLDARGNPVWQPVTPADLVRRLSGGAWSAPAAGDPA
jgi:hypothetical protein